MTRGQPAESSLATLGLGTAPATRAVTLGIPDFGLQQARRTTCRVLSQLLPRDGAEAGLFLWRYEREE